MKKQQDEHEARTASAAGAAEAGGEPGAHAPAPARVDYRVMDVTRMDGYAEGSADSLLDKARAAEEAAPAQPPVCCLQ